VMTPPLSRVTVAVLTGRGEEPLPGPRSSRVRIHALERMRELDPACTSREISLVLTAHPFEVLAETGPDRKRQDGVPVTTTLTRANRDLVALEVDVLDA